MWCVRGHANYCHWKLIGFLAITDTAGQLNTFVCDIDMLTFLYLVKHETKAAFTLQRKTKFWNNFPAEKLETKEGQNGSMPDMTNDPFLTDLDGEIIFMDFLSYLFFTLLVDTKQNC